MLARPDTGDLKDSGIRAARPWRLVASAGTTIGLCIMGDSLLYSILPLEAQNLGLTLPMVGILLSANRLVRLGSNTWASTVYERLGPRRPFVLAAGLGFVSTVAYGAGMGFAVLLAARLLWGVAWSALRQGGFQAIWTGESQSKGRLTGLLWGLVRLGSASAVLVGGYLYDRGGYSTTIGAIAFLAAWSIPAALLMHWPQPNVIAGSDAGSRQAPIHLLSSFAQWPSVLNTAITRWLTTASFFEYLLSSVLVSTTSIFLVQRLSGDVTPATIGLGIATLTGILHGTRWLTDLVLGPLLGFISDTLGQANVAIGVGMLLVAGLFGVVTLPVLAALFCLFVVLIGAGALHVVMSASASGAATLTERPNLFVAVYTTVADAGSALGPLIAFSVANSIGLAVLYISIGIMLFVALVQFRRYAE